MNPQIEDLTRRLAAAEAAVASCPPHLLSQAKFALRASEDRYRRIVETMEQGVWVIDGNAKTVFANGPMAAMLGYETSALIGVSARQFSISKDPSLSDAELQRRRQGFSGSVELELTRKDSSTFWAHMSAVPIYTDNGDYDGALAIVTDMSERKRADALRAALTADLEKQLAERVSIENELTERLMIAHLVGEVGLTLTQGTNLKEMLQRCADSIVRHFDKSLVWIWMFDAKQHDLELQASAGLPPEFNHLEVRIPVGTFLVGRVAEERKPFRTNDVVRDSASGDPVWPGIMAFAGYPLLVNDELVGVLAVSSPEPISEPFYTGLASIADALALGIQRKLVKRENTALEAQLRQSQKMEAVGRLAGGIAHDFNNILTVILNYSEFLLADLKPGELARADVEEISKAGKRAAALTRQLLMFSRQQVLEPKILDLSVVTRALENMLQRLLGEDVVLILQNAPNLGWVHIDPGSIEQVILNLAVNARDAMPQGGSLTISIVSEEIKGEHGLQQRCEIKNGPYIVLSVADTGAGMDPATQARIFEPFFTTKDVGKGTGLGLSTVLGIVQQSNGAIQVQSEVGKGSTFSIYLPTVVALPAAAPVVNIVDKGLRGTETVLLVEDEEQVRMVVRAILERQGYRVIESRTPREAIVYCQSSQAPVHLLLTDVVMPQMSGPELAHEITKIIPQIDVLYMSGYTDDPMLRHGVEQADFAFLQKPFTYDSLSRKVREVLDSRNDDPPETL